MGTTYSPRVATDGLIMYYDMNNTQKSWRGAPATNLIPTPTVNSVPTTGNGWGTYNTNQYNGATYFSIGSIASVSSNIVTTSGNHPLRSYDVVTPQSTGGGVTAGTNYLVKKLSATTFRIKHSLNMATGSNATTVRKFAHRLRLHSPTLAPMSNATPRRLTCKILRSRTWY